MSPSMSSKPSSTAGTTASATNSRSSIGTGFSPRIHPRPKYPSLGYISWQFVNQLVFHCCGMGALLLPLLAPLYFQTRELAHEYQVSNKLYFTLMLSGVHTGVCLADNSPYFICDTWKCFQSAKLYRKAYMEPQRESLKRLAVDQAMGHFLVGPIKAYIFSTLLLDYGLQDLDTHKLPTLKETILTLLLFNVINDVLLYIFHRMLHSKLLYKPLHKKHHEFSGSVGYAAEYSTPVEQVVANQLPAFAGLFVNVTVWQTKCHFLLFWIWIALRLHETYTSHSGYTASQARRGTNPITSSPHYWTRACQIAHHDYHHTHNVGNFGALWVDWICGTMDHYQSIGGFDGYLQLKEKEANHK